MRLSEFIRKNSEQIAAEWQAFALTCSPAADTMTELALRDHIVEMLDAIATDLDTVQSAANQDQKAKGKAPRRATEDTAAEVHAGLREVHGFTMDQLLSEYRALRASVLRLWIEAFPSPDRTNLVDIMRFNEGIDQATAEATARFTRELRHSRDLFLAMLGHDLRNPLNAIALSAQSLMRPGTRDPALVESAATRISISAKRMSALIIDLLNLTRTRLGSSIPIVLAPTNLREICESVIEEVSAAHPGKHLEVIYEGNLAGNWDSVKLGQVVSNLVANAIEHGAQREPVVLTVWGEDDRMSVAVHNEGAPITGATLENLGNLLAGRRLEERGTSTRVKLGLFIAREILAAHGGTLQVTSSPTTGTTFTASWPRLISFEASPPAA